MDATADYTEILTLVLRREAETRYSLIPQLRIVASCDAESGQFLLITIGWDNRRRWVHNILFHARILDGLIVIEADNFEEGLKAELIAAGIPGDKILTGLQYERLQNQPAA
ncbi:MAG: element excision factor XisI family protein [Blastocatellia bacterium]